jgi:hypothetical protein
VHAPNAAHTKTKATVLGTVERGGRIRFRVIASRHGAVLSNAVIANVDPASLIITDDWASHKPRSSRYIDHKIINPSDGVYAGGDVCTNTIEGAFGNLKTGMPGAYKHLWPRYLHSYKDEPGATTPNAITRLCSSSC